MTIRATLKTEGEFISLAFEVQPAGAEGQSGQAFGPLRMATVDDAVVLLSQFARYMDEAESGLKTRPPERS